MIDTKWTPGRFAVSCGGANNYRAEVVADAKAGRKPVVVARIPTPNRNPQQAEGNASLFAAAPELYESTRSLLSWLATGGHGHDCAVMTADEDGPAVPCSCGYSESLTAARRALARARGETP